MIALGVDIGGSGIKGAVVNTETGELLSEKIRLATPQPATPEAVAGTLRELASKFSDYEAIGCGFPATVHHGIAFTAANIDQTWINTPVEKLFTETLGRPVFVLNDADAAGIAEMTFGIGKEQKNGIVMMITVGTGLGSAIFVNGVLMPNTELGHLILSDDIAEHYCSDAARQREDLGWNKWGKRFNRYLQRLQFLFNPDLIILGGGASKSFVKYQEKIRVRTPVVPARTLNLAGIIGAAVYAAGQSQAGLAPNIEGAEEYIKKMLEAEARHDRKEHKKLSGSLKSEADDD